MPSAISASLILTGLALVQQFLCVLLVQQVADDQDGQEENSVQVTLPAT